MAIVEMKRITLLALLKDKEKLLHGMQRMGCVQVTDIPDPNVQPFLQKQGSLDHVEETLSRLRWTIDQLGRFDTTKAPLLGGKPEISMDTVEEILQNQKEYLDVVSAVENCEHRSGDLRGQAARIHAAKEQWQPWASLDIPAKEITNTHDTVQMAGTMPKKVLEEKSQAWADKPLVLQLVGTVRETACIWLMAHASIAESFLSDLKAAGFTQVPFGDMEGTPAQLLASYEEELRSIAEEQKAIQTELGSYAQKLPGIKILYDALLAKKDRLQAAGRFAQTESTFFMRGWVPAALTDKVADKLHALSPSCSVSFDVPEEGDEPPVLLQNGKVTSPFESVVAGFSLPSPYGIDPTAVMMPFFAIFFGMMVSDAGYGLLMAIVIPLAIKLLKPSTGAKKLMWILAIGGVSTLFWGFMYNTWFGFAPLPVYFDPVNNALPVMALCIGIGAIHLFTGLGVGAYMNIKRGKPWDALFDQASWFMLIVGLGLLLLPATAQVGQIMALAGAGIILLTAGRSKSKNPIKRLISGLGALYGITSWVSDLLSYMRLFGMGLATGVIGMVINQLVGMVFEAGPIGMVIGAALFCGGHLFNAGINILGAYVHSCRLQYIEFFGKFYEEGGKPFAPMGDNSRYVRIRDAS